MKILMKRYQGLHRLVLYKITKKSLKGWEIGCKDGHIKHWWERLWEALNQKLLKESRCSNHTL